MPEEYRTIVKVNLITTIEMDVTDTGYLGPTAKVSEHIKRAEETARNWQFLVKQGGGDPKPVRATLRVSSITLERQEK